MTILQVLDWHYDLTCCLRSCAFNDPDPPDVHDNHGASVELRRRGWFTHWVGIDGDTRMYWGHNAHNSQSSLQSACIAEILFTDTP